MKTGKAQRGLNCLLALTCLLGSGGAQADAVWHCSRAPVTVLENGSIPDEDRFQLASVVPNMQAIGITLLDLIDAYSGQAILINGQRLSACFMPGNTPLSVQALDALGLKASTMQLQARKSAIVQSHLKMVNNEAEMLACIVRHYPAVGYLSRQTANEQVVPCF
jgi:hypothetical protein